MKKKKGHRASNAKLSQKKVSSQREGKSNDFQVKSIDLDSIAARSPNVFDLSSLVRSRFNFLNKTKQDRKEVLTLEGSSKSDDKSSTTRDRFRRSHEDNIKELEMIEKLLPALVEGLEESEFSTDEDDSETESEVNEIDTDEEIEDTDLIDRVMIFIDEQLHGLCEKSNAEKNQRVTKENIIAKQKTFLHKRVGSGYVYTPAKPTKEQKKTLKKMREQEVKAQSKALSKHLSYLNETYADNVTTDKKIMTDSGANRQQPLPVQNDALKHHGRQTCSDESPSLLVMSFSKSEQLQSHDDAPNYDI